MSDNVLDILKKKIIVKAGLFSKNGDVVNKPAYYEGEANLIGKYTGQIQNGYPHGNGKFNGETEDDGFFSGEWVDGILSGLCDVNFQGIIKSVTKLWDYQGEIVNGEITGNGTLKYGNNDEYIGQLEKGQRHGKGKLKFSDNNANKQDYYVGDWVNDLKEGQGVFKWTSGFIYEGKWRNDERLHGTMIWPSGEKYEGHWRDGKRDGAGINYFADGKIEFKGTWSLDKYISGYGVMKNENGEIYEGDFMDGKKHGKGIMKYPNTNKNKEEVYEGEWANDERSGKGVVKFCNGDIYEGEWAADKQNGIGIIKYSENNEKNRLSYDGKWKNGMINGFGVMNWKDGTRFEGDWINDTKEGKGKYFTPDGLKYEGEFKGTYHGNGILYSSDQIIKYKGTWLQGRYQTGYGKMEYENGHIYEGEWMEGNTHGKGKYIWPDGEVYDGDFLNGIITGRGIRHYANGDIYEGDFVENTFHGKGIYFYSKLKEKYDGDWEGNIRKGKGMLYDADGNIKLSGNWDNEFLGDLVGEKNYPDEFGTYSGGIKNKSREGQGVMNYKNRDDGLIHAEGEWKNNKLTNGVLLFEGDHKITGQFTGEGLYDAGTGTIELFEGVKFEGEWKNLGFSLDENTKSIFLLPEFYKCFLARSFENEVSTVEHIYITEKSEYPYNFVCIDHEIGSLLKNVQYDDALKRIYDVKKNFLQGLNDSDQRLTYLTKLETEIKKLKNQKLQQDILSKFGVPSAPPNEKSSPPLKDDFDDFS